MNPRNKRNEKIIWALSAFFLPIVLTCVLNIGITFNLPNLIGFGGSVTSYLAEITNNDHAVEILIGVATIFVVFFAFVQIGYSLNYIPHVFIEKYLLRRKETIALVCSVLSLLIVLTYFSFDEQIHRLNQIIAILYVSISILIILFYFRWFVKVVSLKGMLNCILEEMPADLIAEIEKEGNLRIEIFNTELRKHEPFFLIGGYDDFFQMFGEGLIVISSSSKLGIVQSIDMNKLKEIFQDYVDTLDLYVKVGDLIPNERTSLFKVNVKPAHDIEGSTKKVKEILREKEQYIQNCFSVDDKSYPKTVLDDIDTVYAHIAAESSCNFGIAVDVLQDYLIALWKVFDNQKGDSSALIRNYLFHDLIKGISNLVESNLNEEQVEEMKHLIYSIREHAFRLKDKKMVFKLQRLMQDIQFKMLVKGESYSSGISTFTLYLKEISLSYTLQYQLEKLDEQEFQKQWTEFYKPIMDNGLRCSVEIIYTLISYWQIRSEAEMIKYLLNNINTLLTFYSPLTNWDKISREERKKQFDIWFKELFYVSIFIFRSYYYKERISSRIVREAGLVLASATIGLRNKLFYGMGTDDWCSEIIFDFMFTSKASFEHFGGPDLMTTATNVGSTPNFNDFWITFSIYKEMERRNYLPMPAAPGYYPTKVSQSQKVTLEEFIKSIDKINTQKLVDVLRDTENRVDEQKIEEELALYKEHLIRLLG